MYLLLFYFNKLGKKIYNKILLQNHQVAYVILTNIFIQVVLKIFQKEEFKMYSQYCNNHPLAVSELQELYCDSQYIHFFEVSKS